MIEDYGEARQAAEKLATETGQLVRLRAVKEFGRRGYCWNLVPRTDRQFGRDLEGELIEPLKISTG